MDCVQPPAVEGFRQRFCQVSAWRGVVFWFLLCNVPFPCRRREAVLNQVARDVNSLLEKCMQRQQAVSTVAAVTNKLADDTVSLRAALESFAAQVDLPFEVTTDVPATRGVMGADGSMHPFSPLLRLAPHLASIQHRVADACAAARALARCVRHRIAHVQRVGRVSAMCGVRRRGTTALGTAPLFPLPPEAHTAPTERQGGNVVRGGVQAGGGGAGAGAGAGAAAATATAADVGANNDDDDDDDDDDDSAASSTTSDDVDADVDMTDLSWLHAAAESSAFSMPSGCVDGVDSSPALLLGAVTSLLWCGCSLGTALDSVAMELDHTFTSMARHVGPSSEASRVCREALADVQLRCGTLLAAAQDVLRAHVVLRQESRALIPALMVPTGLRTFASGAGQQRSTSALEKVASAVEDVRRLAQAGRV